MKLILEGTEFDTCHTTKEMMNFFKYDVLDEVFFDVYEIKANGFDFVKERKGTWKELPLIEMNINLNGKEYKNVQFALIKDGKTSINPSILEPTKQLLTEKEYIKAYKPVISESLLKDGILVDNIPPEPPKDLKDQIVEYIQKEATDGFISNLVKDKFYSILDNSNDSKVIKFFNTYTEGFRKNLIDISTRIAQRESMRAMESGGGTNAVQYYHGGTIHGNLNIVGSLSATDLYGNVTSVGTVNKRAYLIGDGSNQVYNITHNFGTTELIISVYDAFTNELVYPAGRPIDSNTIEISFNGAIATNSYKVIIMA